MAVVTEPPWVNQTSGVAARNGTTSHTVPFGFTSTGGNELVFVVFGAVTNTVAAGWTERLQPVNSGELSVFTKTSAGESSITVTHNGSDYPVAWAAYELPAGSTWTGGTSSTPTADTFPALSGLPGTEQVVWAARGRVPRSALATAADTTWTSPWVEDADQFTGDNGTTDGSYLAVGHQINVTAISATPSPGTTYSPDTLDFANDREHVVFAFNVAAAAGGGSSVAPSGVAVPVALGAPTLAWSGSVAPDGIAASVSLGSPTAAAQSTAAPDGVAVPVALGSPSLVWSAGVSPDGIPVPVALGAPIVGAAGVNPDGLAVPVALGLPSLSWSGAVNPDGVPVLVAVGAPGASIPGALVVRPFTGTVAKPAAGVVVRPDTGVVRRP